MHNPVRWGILGTANIAKHRFMPAILNTQKSNVVAIGSRNLEKAQEFASEFNIPKHYGSYQDVLDDSDVEAVYIPLANQLHAEWTIKAAEAGKHILCEKPMGQDTQEVINMADHCAKNGVILMEAFMYRHNPRTKLIKEVLGSGKIGTLKVIQAEFSFLHEKWQDSRYIPGKGAGSLMDVGCYCVNICRYLFGSEPLQVLASANNHPEIGCDMTTSGILEFEKGRVGLINCSFEMAFRSSIKVVGTEGVLNADKPFTPDETGKIGFSVETNDQKVHLYETGAVDQFLIEINHFSDCIRTGKKAMLDSYSDAVANARVIDALRTSAETHCRACVG